MAQLKSPQRFTAREVRAFMFGVHDGDVSVERQAWRVWPDDSDEIIVARRGNDFWVVRRLSDQIAVWACGDEISADEHFDRLAADSDGWVEARPAPLQQAS